MKSVIINREDRPKRLMDCKVQFVYWNIKADVFKAITTPNGWRGCRDSHLAVLDKYRDEEKLLVLEDDFFFLKNPKIPILNALRELDGYYNAHWDMLYLGISPTQIYERFSKHLFKVNGGVTTHAIIWNNRKDGVVDFILNHKNDIPKWDVYLSTIIHRMFNCFVIYPILCTQRQEQSDTCRRSDASSIIRNYNKYVF